MGWVCVTVILSIETLLALRDSLFRRHATDLWFVSEVCRIKGTNGSLWKFTVHIYVHSYACVCVCVHVGPTWTLQETISIAKSSNGSDIPESCCRCWEWKLQDKERVSPHKGAYLCSPHRLDDTETHIPSKLIANTTYYLD